MPVRGEGQSIDYIYQCYNATAERPCSPYASCSSYNDTECGYLFSTADQVGFCEVKQPPLWPALLQVPRYQYRSPKYPEIDPQGIPPPSALPLDALGMLYTGNNPEIASKMMDSMWSRGITITDAAMAAYLRAQQGGQDIPSSTENSTIGSEKEFVDAANSLTRGLYEFGLVMGETKLLKPFVLALFPFSASN